jgi:hypothetical protein
MATRSKTARSGRSRWRTKDGFAYLTKRLTIGKAQSAGKAAAQNAMDVMGYVVTVQDGWVVRAYRDGHVEQIEKLQTA